MTKATPRTPPDDRLPTFAEIEGFNPTAAWERLTPVQQRQIGILAVHLGVVGGVLSYEHSHLTSAEVGKVNEMESDLLSSFTETVEPLWGQLYGWTFTWPAERRAAA